jgi:fatty-acyl-CoA synthase
VLEALKGLTVGAALRRSARLYPDAPYILGIEPRLTFAEFDDAVDRLAGSFLRRGIGHGDHVAVWLPNGPEWVLAFFACARIGAVVVPINTRYKAEEAAYILRQSDARALLMAPELWGIDYYGMLGELAPELPRRPAGALDLAAFPALRSVLVLGDKALPGTLPLAEAMRGPADLEPLARAEGAVAPADILLICYTSGTTGKPKGAMHSHVVLRQATKVGLALRVEPGERVLGHMPFYHVAGLFMALIPAMTLGAGLVLMPQWSAERALELIERERVTMFGGIPTHFYDLVDHPSRLRRDISSLKAAWIGGSPVMRETYERVVRELQLSKLLSTYGMTENTISTTFNRWDDPPEMICDNKAPLLADCEVKIVDPETLRELPPGQDGEIWCRGETVMVGYYKNSEATRETITPDGWLRTGDIGHFERGEYLALTGRAKEMFKVGGTNAYPVEIEQHLAKHPGIRMSVVVGVPDARLGEVGYAFVEARDGAALTAANVIAHCKGRIADYKVPRHVEFVAEFPRTSTGKIRRSELAQAAAARIAPRG